MLVRKLQKEDVEQVKDLILDILTKEYPFDRSAYSDSDLYDLMATYKGPREEFFVLENENNVIGTVGVKMDSRDTAILRRLFVDAGQRKKGLGAALVDEAMAFCKDNDYKKIVFRTTSRMTQAIELCKKKGFKKAEEAELQGFSIYKFVKELS